MTNKSSELTTALRLVNDRLHFTGSVEGNAPLSIDYIPPLGDNLGYTSLELLLLSLSSCLGSAMLTLLRRMGGTILDFEILSKGFRREEHPTGFHTIHLSIVIQSPDISDDAVTKVIAMAEEKYCPVWSMIRGNTVVKTTFGIRR